VSSLRACPAPHFSFAPLTAVTAGTSRRSHQHPLAPPQVPMMRLADVVLLARWRAMSCGAGVMEFTLNLVALGNLLCYATPCGWSSASVGLGRVRDV
jgi:hypothetical protein